MRDALTMCFQSHADICVVGQAADERDLLEKASALRPQVIILEPWAGRWAFMRTVQSVRTLTPRPAMLALSGRSGVIDRRALEEAGLHAYLPRDAGWDTVLSAVRRLAPPVVRDAVTHASRPLTPREMEVLRGVAAAMTNQQIARNLGITTGTVKRHLHAAFRKLGAVSRLDAVHQALAAGLITSPVLGQLRTMQEARASRQGDRDVSRHAHTTMLAS
ncbi:response regulator transcription factor [Streptomyces sp. NPDC045456]|uniref:response regulator transcription factor n=1 Tax=Streptomyces sp. NPDC045456 TaxID=3155254 RepID=UPI0033E2F7D1